MGTGHAQRPAGSFFHRRWGETADPKLLAPDVDAEIEKEGYPAG